MTAVGGKMAGRAQSRRHLLAAGLMLGTLAAAGCAAPDGPATKTSSAPPVTSAPASVADSFPRYDSLRAELIAALEEKLPGITWAPDKPAALSRLDDGRCMLYPQTMKSSADVVEPSNHFADIFSAGDPVLARHGFPAFGGTDDVPGGWVVARSTDAAGATLTIESKSPAYLRISVPVNSATCDPAELPQS